MTDVFEFDEKGDFEFDEKNGSESDDKDEFEFNDEDSAPTPKIASRTKKRVKDGCDGSVTSSISQASTATTSNISPQNPTGTNAAFRAGRTRHSRSSVQHQQCSTNESETITGTTPATGSQKKHPRHQVSNGFSPSKHVRFSGNTKKGRPTMADSEQDDHRRGRRKDAEEEEESCCSTSVGSAMSSRKRTKESDAPSNAKKSCIKVSLSSGIMRADPFAKKIIPTKTPAPVANATSNATTSSRPTKASIFGEGETDDFDFYQQELRTPIEAPLGDEFSSLGSIRFTSGGNSSVSLSEQLQQRLQQHDRQQMQLYSNLPDETRPINGTPNMNGLMADSPIITRKVRGAGKDAFALVDSGAYDMLHDDCSYLCSVITTATTRGAKALSPITVEAVSELAALLSTTKARATLFQDASAKGKASLEGVLDVLVHVTNFIVRPNSSNRLDILSRSLRVHHESSDKRKKRGPPGMPKSDDAQEDERMIPLPQDRHNSFATSCYTVFLVDALAAIVHFLSWDCTVTNKVSAFCKNNRGAQSFRRCILQHGGVIQAIVRIIRQADPIVESILLQQVSTDAPVPHAQMNGTAASQFPVESSKKCASRSKPTPDLPPSPVRLAHATTGCQAKSTNNSLADSASTSWASSKENESVTSTSTKDDPTKAGRRQRKRRGGPVACAFVVGPPLKTIAEEEGGQPGMTPSEKNSISPPRSPPREIFHRHHDVSGAKTDLSFNSVDAYSPSRSPPQTSGHAGWRPLGASHNLEDDSSVVSSDSTFLKVHDRLNLAKGRLVAPTPKTSKQPAHKCHLHRDLPKSFGGTERAGYAQSLALAAFHRIIAGKDEGDVLSCLLETNEDEHFDRDNEDEEKMLQNNPLLETNRLLGSSGAIPILSQGISETLAALMLEMEHSFHGVATLSKSSAVNKLCPACLDHLREKFKGFATVVDGACLMNDDNRADFCCASVNGEPGGHGDSPQAGVHLIGSLVVSLKSWMQLGQSGKLNRKVVAALKDMKLSVLRTITSLTHDNTTAAEQLALMYHPWRFQGSPPKPEELLPWSGVEVICHVLYHIVTTSGTMRSSDCKASYDSCTFCLNTLANIVGDEIGGDVRRILVNQTIPCAQGDKSGVADPPMLFLSWLTQWLVGQTETFLDSIMKGSFGDSTSNIASDRGLENREEEQLVTAGNGCVLLACLLMDPPKGGNMEEITDKIRQAILAEMPLTDASSTPSGTRFIQNTLRAFSNLLYISMGDLSVAVVAPIRKLITQLEKIQVQTE